MLFASFSYLIFLPAVVLLYWLVPQRFRLSLLLLASYFFYMSWNAGFVLLVIGMTAFNWFWGNLLHKQTSRRKTVFAIGLFVNLSCLALFKYSNLVIKSASDFTAVTTGHDPGWSINIILPLAISFFTFEFIHYLFEVYRGKSPISSYVLFSLFAAFFPTQIAGPIKRFPDFEAQMSEEKKIKLRYFDEGLPLIIMGLAKKVLLADNMAVLVNMVSKDPFSYGAPELWLTAYAFAFQIYFDFSGYTDIARGSAMLFGYKIPINFNMPYIARNVSDFWHRWHISLSSWLRDYLFIPLGGSRHGKWITHRNLFVTMVLGGLWHGASWNFVVWGAYHGLALIAHKEFSQWRSNCVLLEKFFCSSIWRCASVLMTFHVVCIGWVFFRIENIGQAFGIVKRMLVMSPLLTAVEVNQPILLWSNLPVIVPVSLILLAVLLLANIPLSLLLESGRIQKSPPIFQAVFCSLLIVAMITFLPTETEPFIYFRF